MKASISKRAGRRGMVWTAVVDMPRDPATDKRRQKRLTAPTKKEVEALAAQFIANMLNGGFAEAEATKMTVNEYLTKWLEIAAQSLKPSSHRRYTEITNRHFRPHLGKLQLVKLSGLHIQAFYANRLAADLSPTTVNMLHNILHRALKQAVRLRLIPTNPIDTVDAPRKTTQEMKAWDARQTAAFLAVADLHEWAALWRLAITSGMRRGELLALKWEDIDWAQSALSVRRTLSRGATGGYEFGVPKTQAGKRRVELAASVMAILHIHKIKQIEARLATGSAYQDQGLVFADMLGHPIHPNTMRVHFRKLTAAANVPYIRLHDMRHTHATLMLANGENPKIVSERLGHAGIGITLDRYSHVTPAMQRDAANRLDRLLEGAS